MRPSSNNKNPTKRVIRYIIRRLNLKNKVMYWKKYMLVTRDGTPIRNLGKETVIRSE